MVDRDGGYFGRFLWRIYPVLRDLGPGQRSGCICVLRR